MSSKPAIVLYYLIDQNEPSQPDANLVMVPDDPKEREEFLQALWAGVGDSLATIDEDSGYGDIQIGDGDSFFFLTFVKNAVQDSSWVIV